MSFSENGYEPPAFDADDGNSHHQRQSLGAGVPGAGQSVHSGATRPVAPDAELDADASYDALGKKAAQQAHDRLLQMTAFLSRIDPVRERACLFISFS